MSSQSPRPPRLDGDYPRVYGQQAFLVRIFTESDQVLDEVADTRGVVIAGGEGEEDKLTCRAVSAAVLGPLVPDDLP